MSILGVKTACKCGPINPSDVLPHPRNVAALFWKNTARIMRNPGILLYEFLSPTIQMIIFCLAIGRNVSGVNVAVVNHDVGFYTSEFSLCEKLNPLNLGQLIVWSLDNSTLNVMHYNHSNAAIDQVKEGNAWLALVVPTHFTEDLIARFLLSIMHEKIPQDVINQSTIESYFDMTDMQITVTLRREANKAVKVQKSVVVLTVMAIIRERGILSLMIV
jgi:hypothetical protein